MTAELQGSEESPSYWEWSVCGASATGSQHLAKGLGCDDAYGYAVAGDFMVAVVADGAGSVSGTSALGSHAACQSVLSSALTDSFIDSFREATADQADEIMRWLFTYTLEWVKTQAEKLEFTVPQLATTMCVAVARPGLAIFGQIGDGIIAVHDEGAISTILIEEKTEYANATWFIQSDGAFEESFRTAARTDLTALALSTDGMSYKITNIATGAPYEPFFKGAWENVKSGASAADFTAMLRGIQDDQTGDDKTMVLAALQSVPDRYFPSARPVCVTRVSSPQPPVPVFSTVPASAPAAPPPPVTAPDRAVTTPAPPVGRDAPPNFADTQVISRSEAPTTPIERESPVNTLFGDPAGADDLKPLLVFDGDLQVPGDGGRSGRRRRRSQVPAESQHAAEPAQAADDEGSRRTWRRHRQS